MSPSEDQLRAALRDGEPDGSGGLSADRLIAQASEIRHRRRVRYGSVLGGVAAAAAVGALLSTVTTTHSVKSSNAGAGVEAPAATNAQGSAADKAGGSTSNASAAANCPDLPPSRPTGTGHGSFFTGPVAAVRLCIYPPTGGAPLRAADDQVLTTTLTGAAAERLAAGLDAAATTPKAEPCPLFRTASGKVLAIIPVRADGTTMAPITVAVLDNPCNQPVSNGTVVRYNWTPPSSVTPYLHQAAAVPASGARPVPVTSTPVEHGSPISS